MLFLASKWEINSFYFDKNDRTASDYLQKAGLVVTMSDSLRQRIRYDVTLDEVVDILAEASGPSLSEIVDEQRGPKA